eukprot:3752378-Amphidinium_carterae.1
MSELAMIELFAERGLWIKRQFCEAFVVRLRSTDWRQCARQGQEPQHLDPVPQVAALQSCAIPRRGCQKRNWPVLTGVDELALLRMPLRKQAVVTWLLLT